MSDATDLAVERAAFLVNALAKPPRWVYTHICANCHHHAHKHTLTEDGDLRTGPYVCAVCGCEQPQDGAFVPLSRQQSDGFDSLRGSEGQR